MGRSRRLFLAGWLTVAAPFSVAHGAAARAAQRAGQPGAAAQALVERQAEARAGSREASFDLGVAYDLGRGTARDGRLACHYYAEAGDRGHAAGAFNVAVMHDSGQCGETRRPDLAALWYGRAAAAGVARAQFNLGLLYAAGDGVPHNPAAAASWFRAAAANGIAAASGREGEAALAGGGKGPLLPVLPAFPAPSQHVPGGGTAALVWTAPDQPAAVRFFIEVYALKPAGPVELAGRYLDVTAVSVPLPPDAVQFTWRVLTVGSDPPRYAVGPWQDFTAPPSSTPR